VTRISVRLDITEEEAARQLEGGKPIEFIGDQRTVHVVAGTSNLDVNEWKFWIYAGRLGDGDKPIRTIYAHATTAVSEAIAFAEMPKHEWEALLRGESE
jgi:hypothetical protein